MTTQIGVFAKHWTPGQVKTRLAKAIGFESSAAVAKTFIETLAERLSPVADRKILGFTPSSARREFADVAPAWELVQQCEGDLGQRMSRYFTHAFAAGAERVVLVGADSPNLPVSVVVQAFEQLARCKLVLGPTDDGGYYLVGACGEPPPIFDGMPWSKTNLWQSTLQRLESIGWIQGKHWHPLRSWYDVDTMADLDRMRRQLSKVDNDPALARLAARLDAILD